MPQLGKRSNRDKWTGRRCNFKMLPVVPSQAQNNLAFIKDESITWAGVFLRTVVFKWSPFLGVKYAYHHHLYVLISMQTGCLPLTCICK